MSSGRRPSIERSHLGLRIGGRYPSGADPSLADIHGFQEYEPLFRILTSSCACVSARRRAEGKVIFLSPSPRSLLREQELGSLTVSIPCFKRPPELDAA